MAKIIVSCRFQKSAKDIADLIRYMATREGVEKLPDTKKYRIATSSQHDIILSVVKHFPQSKKFLEYDDFYAMPTRENANEFLDAVAERYADRASELKGLVNYISNRPGVEKLGSHGLFTQFDMPIDLDTVAERVANHDGVIWTEVISLRREDAERLHFAAEGILTMLDYLISLGNQDSTQDAEEESISTEDEYDFDNAYAEYLNDTDDGLYEDDTDDEDEYYGMSM